MDDTFHIDEDHMGKVQAAKHLLKLEGILPEVKIASGIKYTITFEEVESVADITNITINKIQLASDLAHERLVQIFPHEEDLYQIDPDDAEGGTIYNDAAQDIFNDLYCKYLTIIESCKSV